MANTRLTCVVRKGFELPEGLLAAQVAHLSDQWMRSRILAGRPFSEEEQEWMSKPYISILAVNTKEELQDIYDDAVKSGLTVCRWEDLVPSEALKKSIKVWVGISIGPADFDQIKEITGNLPLY